MQGRIIIQLYGNISHFGLNADFILLVIFFLFSLLLQQMSLSVRPDGSRNSSEMDEKSGKS